MIQVLGAIAMIGGAGLNTYMGIEKYNMLNKGYNLNREIEMKSIAVQKDINKTYREQRGLYNENLLDTQKQQVADSGILISSQTSMIAQAKMKWRQTIQANNEDMEFDTRIQAQEAQSIANWKAGKKSAKLELLNSSISNFSNIFNGTSKLL